MATITTISATDLVSASRAVINTNFSNLNTAKVDGAAALTTAGRLVEVASSGVATQTSFASSAVLLSTGTYSDPAWLTGLATTKLTGTLQAAQFPALTGDVTTSAGSLATTLANTAVTPGSYGSATQVATFTVDGKGRLTAAASTSIALALANTPLTTRGDILIATTATPILGRLAKGTQYQVLLGGATEPTWGAVDLSQASAITGTLPVGNGGTGATTLAGAGIVVGSASLTTANALPIVASAGTLGQSDVSLASGVFSRAGTLGLSATGANVVSFSTNGSERGRWTSAGSLTVNATGVSNSEKLFVLANGASDTIGLGLDNNDTSGTSTVSLTFSQGGSIKSRIKTAVYNNDYMAFHVGSDTEAMRISAARNLLVGTTTDDGAGKLQVAGTIATTSSVNVDRLMLFDSGGGKRYGLGIDSTDLVAFFNDVAGITFKTNSNSGTSLARLTGTGTFTLYNQTAVTGFTSLVVRAGAGQSSSYITSVRDNSNNDKIFTQVLSGQPVTTHYYDANNYSIWAQDTGNSLFGTVTNTPISFIANNSAKITLNNTGIGFFGVTPVARQTVTSLSGLATALENYGLLNSGTFFGSGTFYDQTAVTGVTRARFTPGAGQSTVPMIAATTGADLTFGLADAETLRISGAGLMRVKHSGANGSAHNAFSINVGADGTLGPVVLLMGAYPSATGSQRYTFLEAGDNNAYRPIAIQPNGGNVLIGTTTDDGASKLQVYVANSDTTQTIQRGDGATLKFRAGGSTANIGSSSNHTLNLLANDVVMASISTAGTTTFYNPTATTGVTQVVVRAGAGQSTNNLFTLQNNAGTQITGINSSTVNFAQTTIALGLASATADVALDLGSGRTGNGNTFIDFIGDATYTDYGLRIIRTSSGANANSMLYHRGTGTLGLETIDAGSAIEFTIATASRFKVNGTGIGFFGVTPVARAAALTAADANALNTGDATSDTVIGNMRTRIAELETKLQAYGLLN